MTVEPDGAPTRRAQRTNRPAFGRGAPPSEARKEAIEKAVRAQRQGARGGRRGSIEDLLTTLGEHPDWQRLRAELMNAADWRGAIEDAQLAQTLASSRSVPELYAEAPRTASSRRTAERVSRSPEAFLSAREVVIDSVASLLRELARVQERNARFRLVWRGQQDASWAIASSLTRDLRSAGAADEDALVHAERDIMATAEDWGTTTAPPLRFFADMQHMGAPTRFLDASTDPEVAVWFAVEADAELDERDARLLAWGRDPAGDEVVEHPPLPDGGDVPFWHAWTDREQRIEVGWGTGSRTWSWFPAPLNERMRAQRGGFLFDAEPIMSGPVLDVFTTALGDDWRASEISAATTVLGLPSRPDVVVKPNAANIVPLFSFRIVAAAKPAIREYLATKGLTIDRIYPDQAGLVAHLRSQFG